MDRWVDEPVPRLPSSDQPCRWALDRSGLRVSKFHEAVKGLVDKRLVEEVEEQEEEHADQLVLTKQGKTFIQTHKEALKVIANSKSA